MGKNAKIIRVVNGLAFSMVTVFEDIFLNFDYSVNSSGEKSTPTNKPPS